MKKTKLIGTDLLVSNICLGTAMFGSKISEENSFLLLDDFAKNNGNFLDTANLYGRWEIHKDNICEKIIGKWILSRKHKDMVIATKGGHFDLDKPEISRVNKEEIVKDLDSSLKALGLECIDFYWLHRDNINIPIEAIIDIMEELVKKGKIKYYGGSNFEFNRIKAGNEYAKKMGYTGFLAISNEFSLASQTKGKEVNKDTTLVRTNKKEYENLLNCNINFLPFSSSGYGFFGKLSNENVLVENEKLIGNFDDININEKMKDAFLNGTNIKLYSKILEYSKENNISVYAIGQAYLTNLPFNTIPVCGVTKIEQLKGIYEASELVLNSGFVDDLTKLRFN